MYFILILSLLVVYKQAMSLAIRQDLYCVPDVVGVNKDEGLVHFEADPDDILGVLDSKSVNFVEFEVLPKELLVVGHLDNQWNIESFLQPSGTRTLF